MKKRIRCRIMVALGSCLILVLFVVMYQTKLSFAQNIEKNIQVMEALNEFGQWTIEQEECTESNTFAQVEPFTETVDETEVDSLDENATDVQSFYYTDITDDIRKQITGISYPDTEEGLEIAYEDLAYVHVLHYDFDGQVQQGELICNQAIAQDLVEIFEQLYENKYPIEKIRLIDLYNGDDEASMQDNNTSCFNYRTVPGKSSLSNHSYGLAIDINPLYNPYVRMRNGVMLISPDNGAVYADRSIDFSYKIDEKDLCYQLFIEHGFQWGGAWNSVKDYQHFEKKL